MSKTITELWYGNISPIASLGKNNTEMKNLLRLLDKNHQNLEKTLSKEQKKLFERYYECANEYTALSIEQAFCDGFSLGVKILIEALTNAEQII